MARISLERMPESKSDWLSACKKCGIQDPMTDSIHDRSVLLNSGSQVGNGQFLLLRVLWPRPERPFSNNAPNSDKIVPKKYLLVAREALAKSPWFQACLEWLNLKTPSLGLANPQSRKMGPFFLFFQSHTYTQGLEDVESEKVEFSPISSRIRSKVQPEPESGPRTPSTPTPLRSVRTSGMNVDDIDVDMDMEDEEPSPIPTASPLTGEAAKQASPIKNEQEVVFCLLTLLRAVCASVPEGGRATWKADQVEFTLDDNEGKKIFSAKTDINLECDQKEGNQVIGETKRVHRYAENDGGAGVKAQESCQMVGWVFKEPPSNRKLKQMREEKSTHQLISFSQGKDEFFINSGELGANWLDYIRGNRSAPLDFLKIQEIGPYDLRNSKHFAEVGAIILALAISKSE